MSISIYWHFCQYQYVLTYIDVEKQQKKSYFCKICHLFLFIRASPDILREKWAQKCKIKYCNISQYIDIDLPIYWYQYQMSMTSLEKSKIPNTVTHSNVSDFLEHVKHQQTNLRINYCLFFVLFHVNFNSPFTLYGNVACRYLGLQWGNPSNDGHRVPDLCWQWINPLQKINYIQSYQLWNWLTLMFKEQIQVLMKHAKTNSMNVQPVDRSWCLASGETLQACKAKLTAWTVKCHSRWKNVFMFRIHQRYAVKFLLPVPLNCLCLTFCSRPPQSWPMLPNFDEKLVVHFFAHLPFVVNYAPLILFIAPLARTVCRGRRRKVRRVSSRCLGAPHSDLPYFGSPRMLIGNNIRTSCVSGKRNKFFMLSCDISTSFNHFQQQWRLIV